MTEEEFLNLKEGDVVVCNEDHIPNSHESHYSKNCFYTVRKTVDYRFNINAEWERTIFTTSDNQGRKGNGWDVSKFDIYNNPKPLESYM